MRLYTKDGATLIDDPEFGVFTPDANGAFDGLPDAMYAKLHGRPGWENEAERAARLAEEQMEKLRDPATMLAELQKMTAGQGALTALLANALGGAQAQAQSETPADAPPPADGPGAADGSAPTAPAPAPAVKSSRASKKAAAAPPAA